MKPGASKAMSKSSAATCRCCETRRRFAQHAHATNQSLGPRSAGGDGAGRDEHEVVGVRVAVEFTPFDLAYRVLVCAPVDSCVVPAESVAISFLITAARFSSHAANAGAGVGAEAGKQVREEAAAGGDAGDCN